MSTAKAALNAQIDSVHQELLKSDASCKRECAGVDDSEWSKEVVIKAVWEAGYHMVEVKYDPQVVPAASVRKYKYWSHRLKCPSA